MALGSCLDYEAGEGTYVYNSKIFASQRGFIKKEEGGHGGRISVVARLEELNQPQGSQDSWNQNMKD